MHLRLSMRRVSLAIAAAAATAALAGAEPTVSAPVATPPANPIKSLVARLEGLSLQAREQRLYAAAKQEGELVWYTSLDLLISTKIQSAFEQAYPGVKVTLARATSEALIARILSEAEANQPGADIIETNGPEMFFFQHSKTILVPYRASPYAVPIPAKYRFDTWTADRVNNFVIAWNSNLVPQGQEPKSLFELTQDRWKDKVSLEESDIDWYAAVHQYYEAQRLAKLKKVKTPAGRRKQLASVRRALDATFEKLSEQGPIVSGHVTQANLLGAGQFAVAVSQYAHTLEALQLRGAPVAFRPFAGPVFSRPQGVGIAYRLRHPAAALLFYDWLLKRNGGQKALLDAGAAPSHPAMPDPQLRGAGVVPIDLRGIASHWGEWAKRYEALLR